MTRAAADAWQPAIVREWRRDHPGLPADLSQLARPTGAEDATVADGAWSPWTPPIKYHHALIYDSRRDRMIAFGGLGLIGTGAGVLNDVWVQPLGGTQVWTPLVTTGTPPPGRYSCSAVYDSVADRLVIFGGETSSGQPANDVWQLDFTQPTPTWSPVTVTGTPPPPRTDQSTVYDSYGDRMIVFGGLDTLGNNLNDTWVLTLRGDPLWINFVRAGAPPQRRSAGVVYDRRLDEIVVFGGYGTAPDLNDAWALPLAGTSSWIPLFPTTRPPGRHNLTAVYDPVRDRMVIFGGQNSTNDFNDAWELTLGDIPAWNPLSPAGVPPVARFGHASIYDPLRDRMLICAGRDTTGIASLSAILRGDTWSLSFADDAWSPVPALARSGHGFAWDRLRDRALVFGGNDGVNDLADVWAAPLAGGAWTPVAAQGTPPSARQRAGVVYDALRDRLLVFGGTTAGGACNNELWQLALSETPTWSPLAPTGTPPDPREGMSLLYDQARDRLVLFGGHQGGASPLWYNDAWALPLATLQWQPLAPAGTPPAARSGALGVYDAKRDRLIVHGGANALGTVLSDTWALSFAGAGSWSALAPSGAPPALARHAGIYDPVRDRVVLFGGWGGSPAFYRGDLKALTLAGTPAWSTLAPASTGTPRPRADAGGFYDPRRDRLVLFGGFGSYPTRLGTLDDLWWLTWGAPVAVGETPPPTAFALEAAPNPAPGATRIAFTLPVAGTVRASVLDASGRSVRELALRAFPAGRATLAWDGRDAAGHAVAAGLYFVRVETTGASASRRIALIR
ncbi:MAG TPA: kelch repeat-containing protein [Candidatus Eisenbacteria bacterium]|nr:kelch repeat-containing protein [Candidatus Eisenbacteria bacterium]